MAPDKKIPDPGSEAVRNAQFIAAARSLYSDEGTLEFDDIPVVSISPDGGAYIAAWVWVCDADADAKEVR